MTSKTLSLQTSLPLVSGKGEIPALGLGVCASERCEQSAIAALQAGYRHLDTAQIYYNERETGSAVTTFLAQNPAVKRADIFVCSKLWEVDLSRPDMPTSFAALCNGTAWPVDSTAAGHTAYSRAGAVAGFDRSLAATGLAYLDLYLLHNPRPGAAARHAAWLGLQDVLRGGRARAIGVSNFSPAHIEALVASPGVDVVPAVNQIECHPWNQQREIVAYCRAKGIVVTAYSPLTQGKRLGDPVIKRVADKHGRSPAQVVLRWILQMGVTIIPKSDREQRIVENKDLYGFELDAQDLEDIAKLDEGQKGNVGEWDPFAWD
ncbi:hypothetical protein MBLNU459_g0581t1 [Dothideomycetes sp. NU459]